MNFFPLGDFCLIHPPENDEFWLGDFCLTTPWKWRILAREFLFDAPQYHEFWLLPKPEYSGGSNKNSRLFLWIFWRLSLRKWLVDSCRSEKAFSVCVFENIFWRMSVRKCFLASVVLKSFLVSVALKIVFVALAYLVALKMFFCQIFIWKCFLAVVSLKILYPWSIREWFFWRLLLWKYSFGSCCIENIFVACRYGDDFLSSVASKMFFGASSSFENSFLVDVTVNFFTFVSFKMIFWCSFPWKVFGACFFQTVFWRFDQDQSFLLMHQKIFTSKMHVNL